MKRTIVIGMFMLVVLAGATLARAQSPDTVLVNGKILTVDAQSSVREALAIPKTRLGSERPHHRR